MIVTKADRPTDDCTCAHCQMSIVHGEVIVSDEDTDEHTHLRCEVMSHFRELVKAAADDPTMGVEDLASRDDRAFDAYVELTSLAVAVVKGKVTL